MKSQLKFFCKTLLIFLILFMSFDAMSAGSDTIQCLSHDNKVSFAVRMFDKKGYGRIGNDDWIPASVRWGNESGFVLTIFSFSTSNGYNVAITTAVNQSNDNIIGSIEFYKIGSLGNSNVSKITGRCVFSG